MQLRETAYPAGTGLLPSGTDLSTDVVFDKRLRKAMAKIRWTRHVVSQNPALNFTPSLATSACHGSTYST